MTRGTLLFIALFNVQHLWLIMSCMICSMCPLPLCLWVKKKQQLVKSVKSDHAIISSFVASSEPCKCIPICSINNIMVLPCSSPFLLFLFWAEQNIFYTLSFRTCQTCLLQWVLHSNTNNTLKIAVKICDHYKVHKRLSVALLNICA